MDKLIEFLKVIKNPIARIIFLVLLLGAIGLSAFFSTGCAYKFHADNIDNVTREIYLTRER